VLLAPAHLYRRYERLAADTTNVTFVGRLATYKYYNTDQCVGQALATFKKIAEAERPATVPAAATAA
jgi:UDP-galactopyranose mutase